jgi:uncharacterized protein (TIGR03643 family)
MLRVMAHIRKLPYFSPEIIEEIIKLAWADTIPFETIRIEYGLTENQVRKLMRANQTDKTYVRWRKRVESRSGESSKHQLLSSKRGAKMIENT